MSLTTATGCVFIDGDDTVEVPGTAIAVRGDGLVEPVTVRLIADAVDETLVISGDGEHAFASLAAPSYAVALVGSPPCVLGSNATGSVDGTAIVIDLACVSSTRLTDLEVDSLIDSATIALDDATTTYTTTVRELAPTMRITATPRSANARVAIDGAPVAVGDAHSLALAAGSRAVTIVVEHPLSEILTSTYVLQLDRIAPRQTAFAKAFPGQFEFVGWSTSTDGVRFATGAPTEASATDPSNPADNGKPSSGAAYVFVRDGESWAFEAFLKAPNADAGDDFGIAIALDGDRIVVGAPFEDSGSTNTSDNSVTNAGAAYVYRREGTAWVFEQYLKSPRPEAGGFFGWTVAIEGDTIAVGAYTEDFLAGAAVIPEGGQVHVFRRTGTTWALEQTLGPDPVTGAGDNLGYAVALSGTRLIAGAPSGHPDVAGGGAARIYTRSGSTWTLEQQLVGDGLRNDFFGAAVAIDGTRVAITAQAPLHSTTNDQVSDQAGAAYVFDRGATAWTLAQKLAAANAGADDEFGRSVALRGDVLAVSSFREDGGGTGLDPTSNEGATEAGAVYLFARGATGTWAQSHYVKPPVIDSNDAFGTSLAMAPNGALVIGASGEASNGTGAGNNSVPGAGACYVLH